MKKKTLAELADEHAAGRLSDDALRDVLLDYPFTSSPRLKAPDGGKPADVGRWWQDVLDNPGGDACSYDELESLAIGGKIPWQLYLDVLKRRQAASDGAARDTST